MKIPLLQALFLSVVVSAFTTSAAGQLVYTAEFTRALHRAGISYAQPAEQWLHVVLPPRHEFMVYDLVLQNDRNDFEVRYCIRRTDSGIPPSVAVSRLAASISSNSEAHDIVVKIPPDEFLREAFNAERGVIVYFIPKKEFSEKPFGALLSLYSEGRHAIDVVLLYQDPKFDPLYTYRGVRFIEEPDVQ